MWDPWNIIQRIKGTVPNCQGRVPNCQGFHSGQKGSKAREKKSHEFSSKTILSLVCGEKDQPPSEMGPLKRDVGRQIVRVGFRQGGLHPSRRHFQSASNEICKTHHITSRYVCLPREQKTKGLCFKVATLAIKKGGCSKLSPSRPWGLYANPPWSVISNWTQRLIKHPDLQCLMVVPFWVFAISWPQLNKLQVPKSPCFLIATGLGDVPKLPRDLDASTKMAPHFHLVLRQMLQSKEVQGGIIEMSCPIAPP